MEILFDPNTWISLFVLTLLEIVLGIDNIVFLVVVSHRLPEEKQKFARRLGLTLAMLMRLLLLGGVFWLAQLQHPLFTLFDMTFSWRDILLFVGGLFLIYKGGTETFIYFNDHAHPHKMKLGSATFSIVILQIVILDIIFSLDSVLTAVAIAKHYAVMATAIIIAVIMMMIASEPLSRLVKRYSKLKLLALLLIVLIGILLVCEAFHIVLSRYYLYAGMGVLATIILPHWFAKQRGGVTLKWFDRGLGLLMWLAMIGYSISLFAPIITLTSLWVFSNTVSMVGGLATLLQTGNYFVFVIIFLFSILFPVIKMIAVMLCWYQGDWRSGTVKRILQVAEHVGRWSMLDVMAMAMMVVIIRLGVLGEVSLHWGIYLFTVSIILMIAVAARFHCLAKKLT